MERPRFYSVFEGVGELARVTRGVFGLLGSGYKLDPAFRETICLSVTYANDCGP